MTQWVKQAKENSPFQDPIPTAQSLVSNSLVTSFNKLSNTDFQNCGQNIDYTTNITPTKTSDAEFRDKTIPPSVMEKSKSNNIPMNGVTNKCHTSEQSNGSQVQTAPNPIPSKKSGNVSSSRKKKIKRVPLMKISNHAKPNWENKSEFSSEKVSPTDQLDVKSLDSKFSDRFGGNTSENNFKSSGFGENTSDKCSRGSLKVLSISNKNSKRYSNGLPQDKVNGSPTDTDCFQQDCSITNGIEKLSLDSSQNVVNPQHDFNISMLSTKSEKTAPKRRVALQTVKPDSSSLLENGVFQNSSITKNMESKSLPASNFTSTSPVTATREGNGPVKRLTLTPANDSALPVKRLSLDQACDSALPVKRLTPASDSALPVNRSFSTQASDSTLPGKRLTLTPANDSALPVKRLSLTQASDSSLPVKRLTLTPAPGNKALPVSTKCQADEKSGNQLGESSITNGPNKLKESDQCSDVTVSVRSNGSVEELSDIKRKEKMLVYNLAEVSISRISLSICLNIITFHRRIEYGIIGEESQMSTNQNRESTVFSLLIG